MKGWGLSIVLGVFACALSSAADNRWLINGTVVDEGTFPEVVRIRTGDGGCTATVVGSRVILTAAHCGGNGATSTFTAGGHRYHATLKLSDQYRTQNLDLAMGILDEDIRDVQPVSIGG